MVDIIPTENPFDEKSFNEFISKYQLIFPTEYLEYLRKYNDADLADNIVNNSNESISIRYFYGTTNEDYSNIASIYEIFIERMPPNCIPIAEAEAGNQVCMSLAPENYGKIYFWDHETMDTDYGERCTLSLEKMLYLADSFDSLLDKILPYTAENDFTQKSGIFRKIKKLFFH